jgi:hypothetical protein
LATFPERALAAVNAAATSVFDAVFALLAALPPLVSLALVSLVTGVVMLWVVARTSDQPRLAATKRAMHAGLFEIRLFNDDLAAMLRAVGELLWHNARYLRLSLVPLLWMAIPLVIVIAQLQAFYGYAGLVPGEPVLLKAEIEGPAGAATSAPGGAVAAPLLEAPPDIRVETGAVQLAGSNEVLWRIVPLSAGDFTVTLRAGGHTFTKTVHVSDGVARRSPLRVAHGVMDLLLYPSEPLLDASGPVSAISLTYPEPGMDVLGFRVHWLILFMVVSMASAFALARRVGVTL